jgi:hypothetical protein
VTNTDIPVSPINKPSAGIEAEFASWTDRELLLAMVVRVNGIASVAVHAAQLLPNVLAQPMVKAAMKLVVRGDKK